MRQPVGDDRLHAALAERAARLLVGQDLLELHDLARQRLDVGLRRVDHRQPLLQLRQVFVGRLRLLGDRMAEPRAHPIKPFADRFRQFRLPAAEHLGDGAHAALHLGLRAGDLRHAGFCLASALGCLHGSQRAGPARAPQGNRQHDDEKQRKRNGGRQHLSQRECGRAEANDGERKQCGRIIHPFRIDDSIGSHKTKT